MKGIRMKRSFYYLLPWMLLTVAHGSNLPTVDDGLQCSPDENDFIWFNVGCFVDRKVAPLDPTATPHFSSDKEYLQQDIQVCNCLRNNPLSQGLVNSPTRDIQAQLVADKDANTFLRTIKGNIDDVKERLQVKKDTLLFQGLFFSPDQTRDEKVLRSYNLMRSSGIPADLKTDLRQKIYTEAKSQLSRELIADENNVIEKIILDGPKPESKIMDVMTGKPVPGESCMPMHTFLSFNQMPSEKEFWQDISNMNSFKPEDWNYEGLKKEMYDKIRILKRAPGSDVAELQTRVRALRARLVFLNKNPMFKHGLQSKAVIGQKELGREESLQEEVFRMIKTHLSPKDSSCLSRDMSCLVGFHKTGEVNALKEAGAKFFKEDKVIAAMKEQMDQDMQLEINKITEKRDWHNKGVSLTQDLLAQNVKDRTNYDITRCTGTDADLTECTQSFALYCRILDSSKDRIDDSIPDFEEEWLNEISPDPAKNRLYQEKSKKFCEGTFRSKNDPNDMSDFFHFQRDLCKDSKNEATCGDKEKLFKAFLARYPAHVKPEEEMFFSSAMTGTNLFAATSMKMRSGRGPASTPLTETDAMVDSTTNKIDDNVAAQLEEDTNRLEESSSGSKGNGFFESIKNFFSSDEEVGIADTTPVSPVTEVSSEEPGMFSSIMKDLATTMNEGAPVENGYESDYSNYSNYSYNAGSAELNSATKTEGKAALSETQKLKEENDQEKEEMEEELEVARKKLAKATEEASKSGLENRVKLLEQLLAQKDKMAENYEKLIEKLTKEQEEKSAKPAVAQARTAEATPTPTTAKASSSQAKAESSNEENSARAPASVAEQNFSTAGVRSGASSSLSSPQRSSSGVKVNEALLSKYGVTVQGSTEGSILVATDRDSQSIPALTTSPEAKNVPLDVSRTQFDKFRSNDLETLKEIYDSRIKSIEGSIIKISVRTKGEEEALEFYAIKEGDKVVFQPVRKARLGDLKLTLPKQGL
jgi:hypothetical protein